jgi:hypothetical protein
MLYGGGLPVLAFFVLAIWGLKDEDLEWKEVGIAFGILVVSGVVIALTGAQPILIAAPAAALDIWLLYKLDLLGAQVR